MTTIPIRELLLSNPPLQFQYLEKLLAIFSVSPKLHSAYVRGSIARNDYDRVSDIDLVLAFEPTAYESAVNALDAIMQQSFSILFPGWLDRIVPDFGGLGFVYLVQDADKILQIDLYLLPADKLEKLLRVPNVKCVFANSNSNIVGERQTINETFIRSKLEAPVTPESILVETVVLSQLIKKRIRRRQKLLNHSETVMLHLAFRNLLRKTLDPAYSEYGWYHFRENSRRSALFCKWADKLESVVVAKALHDSESLAQLMSTIHECAVEVCPEILQAVEVSFQYYIEFLTQSEK